MFCAYMYVLVISHMLISNSAVSVFKVQYRFIVISLDENVYGIPD